ncbi:MAG: hypothetical protein M3137_17315 [Actinomycetota bacterium]|nr:hypothetical protein [Actinomycetota bacterium]
MRGVITATSPPSGFTHLQRLLLEAHAKAMTGFTVDMDRALMRPLGPIEMADALANRSEGFRERMVQLMMLGELILVPLPDEVAERVERYAAEMGISEELLRATRRLSHGSLGLAALDFDRAGYTSEWDPAHSVSLHTKAALDSAWDASCNDPELAARWAALGDLPEGTLGHGVFAFYQARGFVFPGLPGSAPPLLAQHDWCHVLVDYGSTVESELEVFGFISRANDDPRAFSLLAMVINLFETGYRAHDAGLFDADRGHLSHGGRTMAVRLADAMRRGAVCSDDERDDDSVDYLALDWFAIADQSIAAMRKRFNIVPKSAEVDEVGSPGPWQPGGISAFQFACGQQRAEVEGRPYDSHGACVDSLPPVPAVS